MATVSSNGGARPADPVARGLGVFSFALGLPQILAPGRVSRIIGVRDDAASRRWMRIVGVREIAAGAGIFSERKPSEWIWARVAGDTMDLALLASALRSKSEQRGRTLAATGAVVGAFAADLIDGLRLTRGDDAKDTEDKPMHVKAAITVRRDRDELYSRWRDFESFPEFMAHLEEVRSTGPQTSHWKARGPLGMDVEWDAQITEDVPSERISWRSLEGAMVENSGTVSFVPAPGDRGTEIHLELRYEPPGGAFGATIAKLFGEEPAIQVKDDLRRFKQIVETGEIVRSDGSPEGILARRTVKQRPAMPLPDEELAAAGIGDAS
jgi:uncharacterized membrane protein